MESPSSVNEKKKDMAVCGFDEHKRKRTENVLGFVLKEWMNLVLRKMKPPSIGFSDAVSTGKMITKATNKKITFSACVCVRAYVFS